MSGRWGGLSGVSILEPPGTIYLGLEPQIISFWGEWEESLAEWGVPLEWV